MKLARLPFFVALALGAGVLGTVTGAADGDRILARAGASNGTLRSYAVPVHFDVHLHKPMGLKLGMDATAYFKAPAQSALVITKKPPIIGGLFGSSYDLDMVPQTWPAKYAVDAVSTSSLNGTPVYVLNAVPKAAGQVDHAVFQIARTGYAPLAAEWFYRDGSTVALRIANQEVGRYTLPQAETVAVAMPKYRLDATGRFGSYALNVPVPRSVFTTR